MAMIDRVVQRVVASEIPLERGALERLVPGVIAEEGPLAGEDAATSVVDALVGLGPLEALLRDPRVSDVLVNGPDEIWIERSGLLEQVDAGFADADAVLSAVERVIAPLGLRLDLASPMVDARLADGSRLHATIPPIAVEGPVVAIRRFIPAVSRLTDLLEAGALSAEKVALLKKAVAERANVVVSGGTGAGKTTLLNVLSHEIPRTQRVVVIEDAAELDLAGHVVRLEARPANAEGVGQIDLRRLVRAALRLRPDRIVVGEVRGPEALDLIGALNTGHAGSMSTVHANSPKEALWRLETLALSGPENVAEVAVRRQLRTAVNLIVHVARRASTRAVQTIAAVGESDIEVRYSW